MKYGHDHDGLFQFISMKVDAIRELLQEEYKVRQKQGDRFKSIFIVDSKTGEISLKK